MPDYIRLPGQFKAVAWDGNNEADLVELMEGAYAGESDFSSQLLSGGAVKIYQNSFTSNYRTLQSTDLLVAGPYYGTFGESGCETRVVTAARFALEYDETP